MNKSSIDDEFQVFLKNTTQKRVPLVKTDSFENYSVNSAAGSLPFVSNAKSLIDLIDRLMRDSFSHTYEILDSFQDKIRISGDEREKIERVFAMENSDITRALRSVTEYVEKNIDMLCGKENPTKQQRLIEATLQDFTEYVNSMIHGTGIAIAKVYMQKTFHGFHFLNKTMEAVELVERHIAEVGSVAPLDFSVLQKVILDDFTENEDKIIEKQTSVSFRRKKRNQEISRHVQSILTMRVRRAFTLVNIQDEKRTRDAEEALPEETKIQLFDLSMPLLVQLISRDIDFLVSSEGEIQQYMREKEMCEQRLQALGIQIFFPKK